MRYRLNMKTAKGWETIMESPDYWALESRLCTMLRDGEEPERYQIVSASSGEVYT